MVQLYYNGGDNTIYEINDLAQHIILQQMLRGMEIMCIISEVVYLGEL